MRHQCAVVVSPHAPLLFKLCLVEIELKKVARDDDADDEKSACSHQDLPLSFLEVIRVVFGHFVLHETAGLRRLLCLATLTQKPYKSMS